MRKSLPMCLIAVAGIAAGYVLNGDWVSAQQRPAEPRFAAVPSERGGQDIWGGYLPAVGWPKDLTTLPGHEGWTFGAGQSVFAENPNRVFVLQRGELPAIPRPRNQKIGPSVGFPIGRLPWRDATTASLPGNGGTGQIAEEGVEAWLKAGNVMGVDARWEHCILVYDANGNLTESWTQWDSMLQRPHYVGISPYDPQKHVWILDDHKHAIFKMTNDGKKIVQTIGTYGEPGNDDKHFNRPAFMDWFPDGGFAVSDGYNGTRVVVFDKDGKFVKAWGEKGEPGGNEKRPGYWNNVHGIAIDPKTNRIFVNDRGNRRVQVFDRDGKFLDQWSFGPNPTDVHLFHIFTDNALWAFDRGTSKMLKYDLNGNFLYSWGTWGDFPGAFWGVHGFATDQDGNFYTAAVDTGGAQKFTPRAGANPAMLVGKPLRVAWK
jgi:DNA-binding beta-propeller fold protein YncE